MCEAALGDAGVDAFDLRQRVTALERTEPVRSTCVSALMTFERIDFVRSTFVSA